MNPERVVALIVGALAIGFGLMLLPYARRCGGACSEARTRRQAHEQH